MMYTENPDEWYYPRTEFADKLYYSLAKGPAEGAILFGPRRTGKTSFLVHDFAPLAERNGHIVMYTSFWPTGQPVLTTMLEDFDRTLRANSPWERFKSLVSETSPKFKVKAPGGMLEMEASVQKPEAVGLLSGLQLIEQYCERFASYKKQTFLIFDEFQEIAKASDAESLIGRLRTSLDIRKAKLTPIFAGSSQGELRLIFSERDAPFYRFAFSYRLPSLDSKFIDYLIEKVAISPAVSIDRSTAINVFNHFDQNPQLFRKWLTTTIETPSAATQDVVDAVLASIAADLKFQDMWESLNQDLRDIVIRVANGDTRLTGNIDRSGPGEHTYDFTPVQPSIKTGAAQLTSLGILDRWNGHWQIGDPFLKAWVLGLPESEQ